MTPVEQAIRIRTGETGDDADLRFPKLPGLQGPNLNPKPKGSMMSAVAKALKLIKDEEVEYVDIRFTDPKGKLQHVTLVSDLVDEDFFEEGFMFDGSSIAGWKSIDQSDMKLMPDAASVYLDPFYAEKTLCVHCNVVEPDTGEAYEPLPAPASR